MAALFDFWLLGRRRRSGGTPPTANPSENLLDSSGNILLDSSGNALLSSGD